MNESESFFVAEAVRHARTLSHHDMMRFLRGMSFAISDNPQFEDIRQIYRRLNECDEQLELIASGQMKLPLPQPSTPKSSIS